jgi:chromosome segregation ATPase
MPDLKTYGQIAYDAYGEISGMKSLATGDPLPHWDDLPDAITNAWMAAGRAVDEQVRADGIDPGDTKLGGILQRLDSLALGLETAARSTAPSKKSQIEQGCAECIRDIIGSIDKAAVPPVSLGAEAGRERDEARGQLAREDADFEARLAVLDSVINERDALSNELLAVRATLASEREQLAEARAQHAAVVTEAGHLTVDLATARLRLEGAHAANRALNEQLTDAKAALAESSAAARAGREAKAAHDRFRQALEAIAASDGTCGVKAREALEATS